MTEVFTSPSRLQVPTPQELDVVDATEVSDLIAQTTVELAALEREAEEVTANATQAEEAARLVNVDAASTTWTLVRLQRFLEGLRAEAERDAATMVEVARQHAHIRMEDARAMAARGEARADLPVLSVPPLRPPAPVFAPLPPSPPAAPPGPVFSPPVVAVAPVVPVPPAPVVAEPVPPVVAVAPVVPVPPAPVVAEPAPPVVAVAPVVPVPPAPVVAEPAPVEPQPGPERPTKKRRGVKVLPFSALLEVLAVLLLLVFIVMRLS